MIILFEDDEDEVIYITPKKKEYYVENTIDNNTSVGRNNDVSINRNNGSMKNNRLKNKIINNFFIKIKGMTGIQHDRSEVTNNKTKSYDNKIYLSNG